MESDPATNGQRQSAGGGVTYRRRDAGRVAGLHDERGPLDDHSVPHPDGLCESRIVRPQNHPGEGVPGGHDVSAVTNEPALSMAGSLPVSSSTRIGQP